MIAPHRLVAALVPSLFVVGCASFAPGERPSTPSGAGSNDGALGSFGLPRVESDDAPGDAPSSAADADPLRAKEPSVGSRGNVGDAAEASSPSTTAPRPRGPGSPPVPSEADPDRLGSDEPLLEPGGTATARGALAERAREERRAGADNPYVIVAHRPNYFLPVSYTTSLNEAVYRENDVRLREGLEPTEVRFQISLKTRLNERNLLFADDALALGITIEAWWQLYSEDISSPFRETNYSPEIFYLTPLPWRPFGGRTAIVGGLEHQSNGQVQGLSRSWNRLYATLIYERGDFVASIRPWYRLPEGEKESPDDPEGDDNPDILDFTGHGEIGLAWRDGELEYALSGRGNPATGKGALTVGVTFPLFGRFRALVRYFNGYGDSLVDYDHFQSRLGVGVALTNLF